MALQSDLLHLRQQPDERMTMNTTTTAVRDALGTPMANGRTLPRPKGARAWSGRTVATPVVTSYVPLWRCDADGTEGQGGQAMLQHCTDAHNRTGVFTDRRHS